MKTTNKKIMTMSAAILMALGLASCGETVESSSPIKDAASYLYQMYKDTTTTSASYDVVSKLTFQSGVFDVAWTVTLGDGAIAEVVKVGETKDNKTKIEVKYEYGFNTKASDYTLTATLSDTEGNTEVKSFSRIVPEFKLASVSEVVKEKDAEKIYVLKGVVSAVNKTSGKTPFVLTDEAGNSIFSYTGAEVKLGQEIIVSANYSANYGLSQLSNVTLLGDAVENKLSSYVDLTKATVVDEEMFNTIISETNDTDSKKKQSAIDKYGMKLVRIDAYKIKDGNYSNCSYTADGATQVSMYSNSDTGFSALEDGTEVEAYGYIRGFNTAKITVQVLKAVAKGGTVTL